LNTPSWHHTEEMTSTSVLAAAKGTLRRSVFSCHRAGDTERIVKYIANRPAKNISSLASQTMVPTAAMLGRVTGPWPGTEPEEGPGEVG
jgi:hypothetical protein